MGEVGSFFLSVWDSADLPRRRQELSHGSIFVKQLCFFFQASNYCLDRTKWNNRVSFHPPLLYLSGRPFLSLAQTKKFPSPRLISPALSA